MSSELFIALLSCCGTALGSLGGILAANKLTNYRIKQLENKVDKHNNFANRLPVVEEKITVINHRVKDLEEAIK